MSINNTLEEILENNINYGKNNIGLSKKINIEMAYNLSKSLSSSDINNIIYIDNLSRILEYCGYEVEKEIYIIINNESHKDKIIINNKIEELKKTLDYYRVNINIYSTTKELEDNYIIEDFLTKLRYEDKCYIDNNKLLLKNNNNKKYILLDEDGNYSDLSIDIVHIKQKLSNKYNKTIIIDNYYNPQLKEIYNDLNFDNNLIEFIKKTDISINIKEIEDLNSIRVLNVNNKITPEDLIIINTMNNKINSIINNNKKIDNYNIIKSEITYNIINKLIIFKEVIIKTCEFLNPIILLEYIIELNKITNNYINQVENIDKNVINLLKAIKIVNNNALKLIGVIPKD